MLVVYRRLVVGRCPLTQHGHLVCRSGVGARPGLTICAQRALTTTARRLAAPDGRRQKQRLVCVRRAKAPRPGQFSTSGNNSRLSPTAQLHGSQYATRRGLRVGSSAWTRVWCRSPAAYPNRSDSRTPGRRVRVCPGRSSTFRGDGRRVGHSGVAPGKSWRARGAWCDRPIRRAEDSGLPGSSTQGHLRSTLKPSAIAYRVSPVSRSDD